MSPRLQRLSLRRLRYRYSRDPCSDVYNTEFLESNLHVFAAISTSKENAIRLGNEIDQDPTLQRMKYYAFNGWPLHRSNVSTSVKKYWRIRNEIFLDKNSLFYNKRTLITESLRQEFYI